MNDSIKDNSEIYLNDIGYLEHQIGLLQEENQALKSVNGQQKADFQKLRKKYLKAMDGVLLLQKMMLYMNLDEEHTSPKDLETYQRLEEKYKQLFG